jgi:hypothetical protein
MIHSNCLYLPDRKSLTGIPGELSAIKSNQAAMLVKIEFLCDGMKKLNGKGRT